MLSLAVADTTSQFEITAKGFTMKLSRLNARKSQSRYGKTAKRFAFAIALLGMTNSAANAQISLPSWPQVEQKVPESRPANLPKARLPKRLNQVVQMLGLSQTKPNEPARVDNQPPVLPPIVKPFDALSDVVQASTSPSDQTEPNPNCSSIECTESVPAETTASLTGQFDDVLNESLIDIPIPGYGQSATSKPTTECIGGVCDVSSRNAKQPEVVQRGLPASVAASSTPVVAEAVLLEDTATPSMDLPSSQSTSMDLAATLPEATFSLSDEDPASSFENTPGESLEAPIVEMPASELPQADLAESTMEPTVEPVVVARKKSSGMQVRIEGEPAMVVADVEPGFPVAPAPTFSPLPPVVEATRTRPIQATLATHEIQPTARQHTAAVTGPVENSMLDHNMTVGAGIALGAQDTTSLTSENPILEYSAEHPSVCQLIRTGENSLTVVGLRVGATRIALISTDTEGQRRVEIREVRVGAGDERQVDKNQLCREMSQTVSRMYPRSQVEVIAHGDQIIVQGIVQSESDARKILSLVRKTALKPVVDRLQSYGK